MKAVSKVLLILSAASAMWDGLSRRASRPPWTLGCSVLTRPSIISGKPVYCSMGTTRTPASSRARAVPPVEITSTNAAYTQWLAASQVPVPFDLCQIDAAHAAAATLRDFGFPLSDAVKGQSEVSFDLAGAMTPIYKVYGDGTYTFRMTVTDAEGQSTEATLTIQVDRNNESGGGTTPSTFGIEWLNYDISQEYTLTADMQIDIRCTAPAGIRSLVVSILSETLDVTEAGLPASFDLANVGPDLAPILGEGGFEFPINDKVKNQTEVPFSITPFVSLLLNFEGLHKFQLEMTDNNGQRVTETVQLRVTK